MHESMRERFQVAYTSKLAQSPIVHLKPNFVWSLGNRREDAEEVALDLHTEGFPPLGSIMTSDSNC